MTLVTTLSRLLLLAICFSLVAGWWVPKPKTTWQWQLSSLPVVTSYAVEMYDIDLFDAPQSTIDLLHSQGKKVICYYSAGSYEDWRSDASSFPQSVLGKNLDGWPGERWLDVSNINGLAPIMRARLDLAKAKKCDGVEPDNVDGYTQDSGFSISAAQQITYNKWTATEAHNRNLSIGLKNNLDQVAQLVSFYDFAVNEECVSYNECGLLNPFVTAGKAVFGCMYNQPTSSFCSSSVASGFSFIKKNLNLDSTVQFCLPANFVPTAPPATTTTPPTTKATTAAPVTTKATTIARTTTQAPTTTVAQTTQPPTTTVAQTSAPTTTVAPTTTKAQTSQAPTTTQTVSTAPPATSISLSPTQTDTHKQTTAAPTTSDPTTQPPSSTPHRTRRRRPISAFAFDPVTSPDASSERSGGLSHPATIAVIATASIVGVVLLGVALVVGYKIFVRHDSLLKNPFRNSRRLTDVDEAQLYGIGSPTTSTSALASATSTTTLV